MKKIFSKKSNRIKLMVLPFIILLCAGIISYSYLKSKKNISEAEAHQVVAQSYDKKQAGSVESIIEYGEKYSITIHYPFTKNSNIDQKIYSDVILYMNNFKDESNGYDGKQNYLYIDYDSYDIDGEYISVSFNTEKGIYGYAHPEHTVKNYVYKISNGTRLTLGDVILEDKTSDFIDAVISGLKDKYEEAKADGENDINALVYEYIAANPYCFYFDTEGMVLKFDVYSIMSGSQGIPEITIPYANVKRFFKPELKISYVENELEKQQEELSASKNIKKAVREIDKNKPMVALTFDDGPHPEYTRSILKALNQHKGAATFYVLGNRATSYPDVIEEIIIQGSEVGNHSWSHSNYSNREVVDIKEDKDKVQNAVKAITGSAPETIRVPYGSTNATVESGVELPIVLWSVDTNDWKDKNSKVIIERATSNIKDGDIILMHDIWGETANAVPEIVKILSDKGFQLVTVSEMMNARNVDIKKGKKYFSFLKK